MLGTLGLLLSLAVGVGVWFIKEPARERATHVFGRIESALTAADVGLAHVKTSLATAAERLSGVKAEQRQIAQEPMAGNAARRMMARTVHRRVAPEIENAHEKLQSVAEAAVVVNSVLEDLGSFPFLEVLGLDVGDMTSINKSLTQVETSAWELGRLLADDEPESDPGSQISNMEQTLGKMQDMLTAYEGKVQQVRQRTDGLQSKTIPWITPGTIVISLASFWIALSQLSVLSHAKQWWKNGA